MKGRVSNSGLKDLSQFIKTILSQIESGDKIPIKISLDDDKIHIVCMNNNVVFSGLVKAEIDSQGETSVDADLFCRIVNKMPSGIVTIETIDNKLVFTSGSYKADLLIVEWHSRNWEIFNTEGSIDAAPFLLAIKKVLWAVDKNPSSITNMPLDCIYINPIANGLDIVASDRNVLPVTTVDNYQPLMSILIPFKSMSSIQKFDSEEDTKLIILANKDFVVFNETKEIICKTLNSEFLNYDKLYESAAPIKGTITIPKKELAEILKRVGILFNGKYFAIDLTYDGEGQLTIKSLGEGSKIEETISVGSDDVGQFSVCLNTVYLSNGIEPIEETVLFDFIGDNKPIIVRDDNGTYKSLIMQIVRN